MRIEETEKELEESNEEIEKLKKQLKVIEAMVQISDQEGRRNNKRKKVKKM